MTDTLFDVETSAGKRLEVLKGDGCVQIGIQERRQSDGRLGPKTFILLSDSLALELGQALGRAKAASVHKKFAGSPNPEGPSDPAIL